MEEQLFRLGQEAELEKLHRSVTVPGTSGTAGTTDFPACRTIAMREVAIGSARDCRCIHVQGNQAYVGVANGGVAVLDISDPATARVLGGIHIPGCEPTSLALAGKMLYVSDRLAGCYALDMTNPLRPVHTATVPALVHTQNRRIFVAGSTLVLVNDHAFSLYDLSIPERPVPLGHHHRMRSGAGFFRGAAMVGKLLYLTQGPHGVWTFDLGDPTQPRAIGGQAISLDTRPNEKLICEALASWQGRLFVGTSSGVWVMQLGADGIPQSEAFFTGPGYVRDTAQGEGREHQLLFGVFESYDHAQYVFDLAAGPRYLGRQRLSRAVDRIWGFARAPGCTLAVAGMQGILVTVP